jgi:hypothetical protein
MAATGSKITFIKRMGQSWSVKDPFSSIRFNNRRGMHVETDLEGLANKSFVLGQRREREKDGKVAVMYDVQGVTIGRHVAHFTVFFGSAAEAKDY